MRSLLVVLLLHVALLLPAQEKPTMVQISGTVSDATSGKPIPDCLVEHYDTEGRLQALVPTNGDGLYALFLPAGVAYELRVARENGYLPTSSAGMPILPGRGTHTHHIALTPR